MNYLITKSDDLGYIQLDDPSTGIRVGCIPNSIDSQRASLQAMALARYSRSVDSMPHILKELSGADSSRKLESIAIGYGHASVAGMAHTAIYIEEVSTLDALRFFDTMYVLDGQHRSTRYQDFSNARYMAVPSNLGTPEVRLKYKQIILKQMKAYRDLYEPVYRALGSYFSVDSSNKEIASLKMRALDCTKYLLPLGIKDGFGAVLSIRELSNRYISKLLGSADPVSKRLADMLFSLMTVEEGSYKGEGSFLVKHCRAKEDTKRALVEYVKKNYGKGDERWSIDLPTISIYMDELSHSDALMLNLSLLVDPLLRNPISYSDEDLLAIGEISLRNYSHHSELGNEFLSGSISIQGMADIGTIKDLVRHRSLRRFIPLLDDHCSIEMELDRSDRDCFFLPPYLYEPKFEELRNSFTESLVDSYSSIKEWYREAKLVMSPDIANNYLKRLLPHAHATQYVFSGSSADLAYLCSLRTGLGGHIQYRMLCYEIVRRLVKINPMWSSLLNKLEKPDPFNKEQFLGRS
jgi:thymidylate synthase ThyX